MSRLLFTLLAIVGCGEKVTERSHLSKAASEESSEEEVTYGGLGKPPVKLVSPCPTTEDQLQDVIEWLADLLAKDFGTLAPKRSLTSKIEIIKTDVAVCLQNQSVPNSIKVKLNAMSAAAEEITAPVRSGADSFSVTINDESYLRLSEQEFPLPERFFTKSLVKAIIAGDHKQIKNHINSWNIGKSQTGKARTIMFETQLGSGALDGLKRLLFYVPDGIRTTYTLASYDDAMTASRIMSVVGVVGDQSGTRVWFRDTKLKPDGSIETPYNPLFNNDCSVCHVGRGPMAIHPKKLETDLYPDSGANLAVVNESIKKIVTGFTKQAPSYLTPKYLTVGIDKNSSDEFHNRARSEGLTDLATCNMCHDGKFRPELRAASGFPLLMVSRGFMPPDNSDGGSAKFYALLKDDYKDKICRKMGGCKPKPVQPPGSPKPSVSPTPKPTSTSTSTSTSSTTSTSTSTSTTGNPTPPTSTTTTTTTGTTTSTTGNPFPPTTTPSPSIDTCSYMFTSGSWYLTRLCPTGKKCDRPIGLPSGGEIERKVPCVPI